MCKYTKFPTLIAWLPDGAVFIGMCFILCILIEYQYSNYFFELSIFKNKILPNKAQAVYETLVLVT